MYMKIECSIEKIREAISSADRITGKNLTLPILGAILFIAEGKTIKIRATNLSLGIEIEVPAKIEQEGTVAVKSDVISTVFGSIQNGTVSFQLEGDMLRITTKQNTISVKTLPYDDFPTIPVVSGDSFSIPGKKLIEGIRAVAYSAAVSDIKPEISSVYIYPDQNNLVFVATDSFRLAEKKIALKKVPEFGGILIPFKNVAEIMRIIGEYTDDVAICFSKNQLSILYESVYITSRLIDGIFPDYKQIIPKEFTTNVTVLKSDIVQALKLSHIFSDKFNHITLSVDPVKKYCAVYSKNVDVGENNTILDTAISGLPVEVSLNHRYMIDCFQSIHADSLTLSFTLPNKPVVLQGVSDQTFMYLIMPMNR